MLWQTFFTSERVEFSHVETLNGLSGFQETWRPAKVVVSEITDNKRWLMVTVQHDITPVIFRVINEKWSLSCDERSLTMLMRHETPNSPMVIIHKLRFTLPEEYWMFVAAVSQGRVAAIGGLFSGGFQPPPAEGGGFNAQLTSNTV